MRAQNYLDLVQPRIPLKVWSKPLSTNTVTEAAIETFYARLMNRLEWFGISDVDLQPRDVPIWDPDCERYPRASNRNLTEHDHDLQWMRKARLDATAMIEAQAWMQEKWTRYLGHNHFTPSSHRGCMATNTTLTLLDRAKSRSECLGVWAAAALVPLCISRRANVAGMSKPPCNDDLSAEDALASSFALARIDQEDGRRLWTPNATYALPETLQFERGASLTHGDIPVLDYIAGLIAATLGHWAPVRLVFQADAPGSFIQNAVLRRSAVHALIKEEREQEQAERKRLVAKETQLERRHRMLPNCWKGIIKPASKRLKDFTRGELLDLRRKRSLAAMAVEFGITEDKLQRALKAGLEASASKPKSHAKQNAEPVEAVRKDERSARSSSKQSTSKRKKKTMSPDYLLNLSRSMPRAKLLEKTGMSPSQLGRAITKARESVDA